MSSLARDPSVHKVILSVLLFSLSYPPLPFGFLAWFCLVPLIGATAGAGFRRGFRTGYAFGLMQSLILLYWVGIGVRSYVLATEDPSGTWSGFLLTWVAVPGVTLLVAAFQGLYTGLMGGLFGWLSRPGGRWLLTFPLLWTVMEYSRGFTQLAFPWIELAYTQSVYVPMIQTAALWGHLGVGLLLATVNLLFYLAWNSRRTDVKRTVAATVSGLVILLAMLLHGILVETVERGEDLELTLVQHNLSMREKYGDSSRASSEELAELALGPGAGADLVVYPELTLQHSVLTGEAWEPWSHVAGVIGCPILLGTVEREMAGGRECSYNSAVQIDPGGSDFQVRHKIRLVPFSERTPYVQYVSFLEGINFGKGSMCMGDPVPPFSLDGGNYTVLICFEAAFSDLHRRAVTDGADFLVGIMNNSWWGRSPVPWQHMYLVQFRAVENRRWYACASNSGFSFFCDPRGGIHQQSGLFEEVTSRGHVQLLDNLTFYTRHGDYLPFAALAVTVVLALIRVFRAISGRRRREQGQL